MDSSFDVVAAVKNLSRSLQVLRGAGVIRSARYTGDIGEWYVEQLYGAARAGNQVQKGFDIKLESGERLQVKTQTYDPANGWNYLDTAPALFDSLVVVILTRELRLCALYHVPAGALVPPVLRVGKESKPFYYWKDLEPWRVDVRGLPGYPPIAELVGPCQ